MRTWLVVLVGCLVVPGGASAFRTLTDDPDLAAANGQPIGWTRWPIGLEVYSQPADLRDGPSTRAALEDAIAIWDGSACAVGALASIGMTQAPGRLGDGRNTVQWVHAGWGAYGESDAVAITETQHQIQVGRYTLIEADIYLNATMHWDAQMLDHLDGVLAHELGHVLGIVHPCEVTGTDAPRCGPQPMSLMHPLYDPRAFALTRDDDEAACFLYPTAGPREEVEIDKACAVAGVGARERRASQLAPLAMIGSVLVFVWRRRSRLSRTRAMAS